MSLSYALSQMKRKQKHENSTKLIKKNHLQSEKQIKTLDDHFLKEIHENKLAVRGQIDVIEMSEDVSEYKYLFIYEDRSSRYIVLKALRSNDSKAVAIKLLDVMTIIGVPHILQSGNGQSFAEEVVSQLLSLWNGFKIISDEVLKFRNERNFQNIIKSWLIKNPKQKWLESIKLIQVLENATFSDTNDKYPYESLFKRNVYKDFFQSYEDTKNIELTAENGDLDDWSSISDECNFEHENSERHIESTQNLPTRFSEERTQTNCEPLATKELPEEVSVLKDDLTLLKKEENHMHKCKFCPKQYMKMGHLTNHLKSHKKSIECTKCSKTFRSQALFEHHVQKSHKEVLKDDLNAVKIEDLSRKENATSTKNINLNEQKDKVTVSEKNLEPITNVLPLRRKSLLREKRLKVNETLACCYCEQKFDFPSVLKRHIRSHTNERPYECQVCNKSFKQLGHLSQHSVTHTDYRSLKCSQCGEQFESLDALKIHSEIHPADSLFHKNLSLTKTRLFECDICKKVFSTKSVLERHILTHTQERHFECDVCGKRFKQSGHVKSHMLVHTGERKFQCTICSKRFSLANSLKKHMYIHNGDKPYQCDVCGARFLEKRNLNGHLLTHTNEKPFVCKICGKRYTLADTLRRHVSAAHEDGRTYQCEICAKMFKQLAHLSVHKKVHNDERPFQCHLCEKNFKHKNVLKSHLAIHANVRPFECDECKATFVRKTNLQTHIASAHMNERPYTCNICGKKFKQVSHLNGHIIVHSNSMPYQCDFCDRRCNRLDNLKKHMKIHTKNVQDFSVHIDSKIGLG